MFSRTFSHSRLTVTLRLCVALAVFFCVTNTVHSQAEGPLGQIPNLRDAVSKRASSFDRQGGYIDSVPIKAGDTLTLLDTNGPGSIRHIWMTISSPSQYHLRELVIRMYWDGETDPSVEVPLGDFFGSGFGMYHSWHSLPLTVQYRALNCYFPMPFGRHARITVTNDGAKDVDQFYFHVDYEQYPASTSMEDKGRFHASWHRENPTIAIPVEETHRLHPSGDHNYIFLDVEGKGQVVGIVLNVQGFATGAWAEGDDMWFVDGEKWPPAIHGTGLEDYFNNAWGFQEEFNYPFIGYSRKGNPDATGLHTMYRFHIQDPIYFSKSLVGGIEHGHANSRSDDFSSTAYWYQTEPHKKFQPLPPVDKRMPNLHWKIQVLPEDVPD
jgi:hypothetical protein